MENNKEKIRAIIILNEIAVECARILSKDQFPHIQERVNEVRDIILNEVFPPVVTVPYDIDIKWSETNQS